MAKLFVGRKGDYAIVAGVVKKIKEAKEGKVVNVTLEGDVYDKASGTESKKTISIGFWNSEKADDLLEGKNQNADQVKKAKLYVGAFIMAKVYVKDDNYYGQAFRYSGRLSLAPEKGKADDKGLNVIIGSVTSVRMNEEKGVANINIPFDDSRYDESGNKVGFGVVSHQIAFWDNEKRKPTDAVVKYLTPKEEDGKKKYTKVLVVASDVKGNRTFGEDGYSTSYTGFRWEFVPVAKKKEDSADSTPDFSEDEEDGFMNIPDDIEEGLPFN